jgi:hypothetical protein
MGTATKQPRRELAPLRHLDGCPEDPERIEAYPEQLSRQEGPRVPVTVTRCMDCGAQSVDRRDDDEGDA